MTVSDAIIKWLKTFNPSEYWKMSKINTDRQPDVIATYALTKEPIDNVKRYVSGREEHTQYYQISARLDFQTESDRKNNGGFCEALEEWVNAQDKAENRPIIAGANVSKVFVSSSFYVGTTAENSAVYSLTLAIKFERRS